jgi:hypothetical protein
MEDQSMFIPNGKVSTTQILFPVVLLSFVLFIMLFFQTTQIMLARQDLVQAQNQQSKPLEDAQKVQAQLNALATGTAKLADNGDKGAAAIIARMKKLGLTVNANGAPPPNAMKASDAGPQGGAPSSGIKPARAMSRPEMPAPPTDQ